MRAKLPFDLPCVIWLLLSIFVPVIAILTLPGRLREIIGVRTRALSMIEIMLLILTSYTSQSGLFLIFKDLARLDKLKLHVCWLIELSIMEAWAKFASTLAFDQHALCILGVQCNVLAWFGRGGTYAKGRRFRHEHWVFGASWPILKHVLTIRATHKQRVKLSRWLQFPLLDECITFKFVHTLEDGVVIKA